VGTDIQAFIEHRQPSNRGGFYWDCFAEVFLSRDYRIFGALAGVRNETAAVYEPRGLPDDHSATVGERYYVCVAQPGEEPELAGDEYLTVVDAEEAVSKGACYRDSTKTFISGVGFRSPSWLGREEIVSALLNVNINLDPVAPDWAVTLETMALVAKNLSGPTRLVFWFCD
jgi:hypothetical protein